MSMDDTAFRRRPRTRCVSQGRSTWRPDRPDRRARHSLSRHSRKRGMMHNPGPKPCRMPGTRRSTRCTHSPERSRPSTPFVRCRSGYIELGAQQVANVCHIHCQQHRRTWPPDQPERRGRHSRPPARLHWRKLRMYHNSAEGTSDSSAYMPGTRRSTRRTLAPERSR